MMRLQSPAAPVTPLASQRTPLTRSVNVGDVERIVTLAAGAAGLAYGLRKRTPLGWVLGAVSSLLLVRAASGRCPIYRSLGVSTRWYGSLRRSIYRPIEATAAVTIRAPAAELYTLWHNFENLPVFLEHLKSVRVHSDQYSHWTAHGPGGITLEWDALITATRPHELIVWRSVEGAEVDQAGEVEFRAVPDGTEVRVRFVYVPPVGILGEAVAKLLGANAQHQLTDDLQHLKELVESGEIAAALKRAPGTTYSRSTGRRTVKSPPKTPNPPAKAPPPHSAVSADLPILPSWRNP